MLMGNGRATRLKTIQVTYSAWLMGAIDRRTRHMMATVQRGLKAPTKEGLLIVKDAKYCKA